ncbi:MAG TPA: efflux RND transporter permease subunit, partial [Pirellulales bacterium]|nr:efflux RND transporter permease subunit [Pirellulales bacterium]
RIIEFSIRNRAAVILAALGLALWGVYSAYHTPMDAIPNVSENQLLVFADWPGHAPQEIEDQIAYPLSVQLQGLAGVRVVRSSSEFNFASLSVILEDSADFYFARQQVSERLARVAASLPAGVSAYLAPDGVATGQIFWYVVEGAGYDLGRLRAIQDWYVRNQLSGVQGVAEVASVGGHVSEYQIELDPDRLADFNLTPGMVLTQLSDGNRAVGGYAVQKANAEYLVRGVSWLGADKDGRSDEVAPRQVVRDLEQTVLSAAGEQPVRLADVARVSLGPQFRRGVVELDGNEVAGGVVLMRQGENPLEVTRRLREKLGELAAGLPPGVRVTPVYDRTPLIEGAVATVTGTLVEAMVTATICVLVVLLHFRTSLVIVVTLPLAALSSFAAMWTLRRLGIADIQTNIMSLAGIVVSIGVLVDSSIVMAENAMHRLKTQFGDQAVRGDVRRWVLPACQMVGRPMFFSVAIMLISFLPVFCLGGIQGKMFRPLAFTKSFALLAAALLAITLVPALCTIFIRGRLRHERESWLVRSLTDVYRPVLESCFDRPAPLAWLLGAAFVLGCAPLGSRALLLSVLLVFLAIVGALARTWKGALVGAAGLTLVALAGEQNMRPLLWQRTTPLDEGMVMDMPITVPRASITEAADDLKARDMLLCRFPEVAMVLGKAGRAETPSDPAPVDMIETMIEFRPRELWPKRKLHPADARRHAERVLQALAERGFVEPPDGAGRGAIAEELVPEALARFDGAMREYAFQRNDEFQRSLGPQLVKTLVERMGAVLGREGKLSRELGAGDVARIAEATLKHMGRHLTMSASLEDVTSLARHAAGEFRSLELAGADADLFAESPNLWEAALAVVRGALGKAPPTFFTRLRDEVDRRRRESWAEHLGQLNAELAPRGCETFTRIAIEESLARLPIRDPRLSAYLAQVRRFRSQPPPLGHAADHEGRHVLAPPDVAPQPELKALQEALAGVLRRRASLDRSETAELADPGGELDRTLQMPGWANVWTRPIQNRVDMLFTGVNTDVGVRVLGRKLDDVVRTSEEIAAVLKSVSGAADVMAETVRGKGYLEIRVDRDRAALAGASVADVNEVIEIALGGKVATSTVEGRERHDVRVRYRRRWREDEEAIKRLMVPVRATRREVALTPAEETNAEGGGAPAANSVARYVELAEVADVRTAEGPATIKSENGLLRNYVRLNVRGRSAVDFVDEARRVVAERVRLPEGVYLEWTGQFEHDARAVHTLLLVSPLAVGLVLLILYWTYHDLADAILMLLTVPGAIAGGVLFQWLLGYDFSVTVLVGYIACFGMAASTGMIMLVYLREAVNKLGGLEQIDLPQLRSAVLDGAVHRLRPKLLTEGTTILGLAPMLWATGVGAEVIKPMAAPVLGGILVADEVIDLLLPVLFYWVRRRRWTKLHHRGTENPSRSSAATKIAIGAANRRLFAARKAT